MKKLKELWNEERKKVILYSSITIISIILLIVIGVVLYNVLKKYDYNEVEQIMITSSKKYLRANQSLYPTEDSPVTTIDTSTLISGKYMKELGKLSKDTGCFGEVNIYYNDDNYYFIPSLTCANYKTKSLKEKILETEERKEKNEEGLHSLNDYYTYRGEYVKNYISFGGFLWRIVKFNNEKIYIILADTINNKTMYVYDDRYNETIESNRGKNSFESSRIYLSLRDIYNKDFANYHQYILTSPACVHQRNDKEQNNTGTTECYTTFNTKISMLPVYDYINASIDPLCTSANSRNCSNYNYLSNSKNKWWLLNGTNENTYEVYGINSGRIELDYASGKKDLRPVFVISSELVYKKGDGTESNPYTFYEY